MSLSERFSLESESVLATVLGTGRTARMDDYEDGSALS